MSEAALSGLLTLLETRKPNYGGAIIRLAQYQEDAVNKLCFGRVDFIDRREPPPKDVELDYGRFKLTRTFLYLEQAETMTRGLARHDARLPVGGFDVDWRGSLTGPPIKYVASLQKWGMIQPAWPSTPYYFQADSNFQTMAPREPLVRLNLPSYPDGNQAISEFCDLAPGMEYTQGQLVIILPDFRARFEQLKILNEGLSVEVQAHTEDPANLRVKFYVESGGTTDRSDDLRVEDGKVSFPYHGELRFVMVHLLLTATGEEVDSRFFAPFQSAVGVVVESSELRVKELARVGEGLLVEYKEALPSDEHRFLDSVVAFANTNGGTILVGVSDNCELMGVKEPEKVKKTITNWISDKCDPRPAFTLSQQDIDGKTVIVVDVPVGQNPPYHDRDCGFYRRTGASNRQATRYEVQELFRGQLGTRQVY